MAQVQLKDLPSVSTDNVSTAAIPVAVSTTPYQMSVDQVFAKVLEKLEAMGLKIENNKISLMNEDAGEFMAITAKGIDGKEELNLLNEV